jgi:hypothetical protein
MNETQDLRREIALHRPAIIFSYSMSVLNIDKLTENIRFPPGKSEPQFGFVPSFPSPSFPSPSLGTQLYPKPRLRVIQIADGSYGKPELGTRRKKYQYLL